VEGYHCSSGAAPASWQCLQKRGQPASVGCHFEAEHLQDLEKRAGLRLKTDRAKEREVDSRSEAAHQPGREMVLPMGRLAPVGSQQRPLRMWGMCLAMLQRQAPCFRLTLNLTKAMETMRAA